MVFQNGDRIHLIDESGRQYAVTLKAGEIHQHSGDTIPHDALIGRPDGSLVTLSRGKRMLAVRPTFGDYVLKMPRGAQVLYPKDLALMTMWADIYPGARVLEAGTGSGALTMALLRAVGPHGHVVTYETRDDFARTARKNIERYLGPLSTVTFKPHDVYAGIPAEDCQPPFDRIILDLPEPWRVVPHAAAALRSGGIYLSFVPTIPQVMQTVSALEHETVFALIHTFETLLRTWNIQGRSVRPDHRMVAHSGFITVARKVEPGLWRPRRREINTEGPAGPRGDGDKAATEEDGCV